MTIRVRNFGPVKAGYEVGDGYLDLPQITLFCGPQGSGKSTVTKLISTFSWVEKRMFKDDDIAYDADRFKVDLAWQGIDEYLCDDTEIDFEGMIVGFHYAAQKMRVEDLRKERKTYSKPKISYMPAERNISSVIRKATRVENLPEPLMCMQTEFEWAKRFFKRDYKLPANGFGFEYDGEDSWISNGGPGTGQKTRLDKASSGLQSMTPLLMVSEYLATKVVPDGANVSKLVMEDARSSDEKLAIEMRVDEIQRSGRPETEKDELIARVKGPCRRFMNIVEEPEQNLYPLAQYEVVKGLIRLQKKCPGNSLVLSTHSPFVVNTMVMAAMSAIVYRKARAKKDYALLARLAEKWPEDCSVRGEDMALYELDERGSIKRLSTSKGLFSDANKLNAFLGEWNDGFNDLIQLELEADAR